MNTYAVDFESYYDKSCSITTLGPRGYFSHPDFDPYLVSVVGDDGFEFCGNPRDFDWSRLQDQTILSHNASFDESLYRFGVEQGWWGDFTPHEWHCTADMAAYLDLPRSLAGASAAVFDLEVSKATRNNMAGKRWADMAPEFQQEVIQYALKDSVLCLRLWDELNERWPQQERDISRMNRRALQRGLPVDQQYLRECLETLALKLHEAEQRVPWIGTKPLLSRPAFNEECRKVGIEPPASLALDNEEANEWIRLNGMKYAWVAAIRDWRRINALKRKIEAFDAGTMPDGRYYGGIMYFGANATGRFSGSGGNLNLQNLPRDEHFGVQMRHIIRSRPERRLVVVDLSQIEVRTLCWLAGDTETLEMVRNHPDIYTAFAIRYGLWSEDRGSLKQQDPQLRTRLIKPMTLGCGYQVGPDRLSEMAGMDLDTARTAVQTYRASMGKVVKLWEHYQNTLRSCCALNRPLRVRLPSGRVLNYGEIRKRRVVRTEQAKDPETGEPLFRNGAPVLETRLRDEFFSMLLKNGKRIPSKLYGGLVVENLSQGLARDIFADRLLEIERAGYHILMHVHDEVMVECWDYQADDALRDVVEILTTPPAWIPDIPLAAEGHIMERYEK